MTAFTDLLADFQAEKHFLIQIDVYDLDSAGIVSEYFSTQGFTSAPGDTPANTHYEARLLRPLDYQRALKLEDRLSGLAFPSGGSVKLNNADHGLDRFARYATSGRRVRVWLGGPDFALTDYGLIADTVAEGHDFDDMSITINLSNPQHKFDLEIQSARFAGTGNAEGGADVANRFKPFGYGPCRDVEMVYLGVSSGGKHLFAVGDGPIVGVLRLLNYGLALTFVAGTPTSAEWSYDAATGIITLGGAFEGSMRADVIGRRYLSTTSTTSWAMSAASKTFVVASATGFAVGQQLRVARTSALHSTWGDGKITAIVGTSVTVNITSISALTGTHTDWTIMAWGTVAGIVKHIAAEFDVTTLDTASFTALDTALPATVGWWVPQGGNGVAILDAITKGAGVFAGFDRSGQFEVDRVSAPSVPVASYDDSHVMADAFDRVDLPSPPHEIVVRWRKNWAVLSAGDIAGAVTEADRAFLLNEWRRTDPWADAAVLTAYPSSPSWEVDSVFDEETDADTFTSRLGGLFGVTRNYCNITFKLQPLARDLNQAINLTYPYHGLSAGEDMLIVDITEEMDPEQLRVSTGVWY